MTSAGSDCLKSLLITPIQHRKLFLAIVLLLFVYTCTGRNLNNTTFDYFVFSQRWLPTACIEYMEKGFRSGNPHYCSLPKNFKYWAIHGLWPTENKHMGPFFCNKSMPFDMSKVEPIHQELRSYWPNIEGGQSENSLWQHEWEKHGTCAAQVDLLDSELKYFKATLQFFKAYNMQDLFERNNVAPSHNPGIAVSDLFHIIKSAFGKLPQIHCINEVKNKQPFLSEIRLCFTKDLHLMDCKSIHDIKFNRNVDRTEILTNCPLDKKISFPDEINIESVEFSEQEDYYDRLVELLHFLRFLQWASI